MTAFPTIPASLTCFIRGHLYRSLPLQPDLDPETLEVRNQVAMAAIMRLTPMNTAEALLAVQVIASEAHAMAALQEAVDHRDDVRVVGQCRAQSAMMSRQAIQVRKELRAVQAERRSAEYQRQQEAEAAEREAEAAMKRADETAPAPFMRRLAQRRRDGAAPGSSHEKGQSPIIRPARLERGSKATPAHAMIPDGLIGLPASGRDRTAMA